MSDYSAVFLYSSSLGAPLPLPPLDGFNRASRREKQARRPNSTPDGHIAASRHSRSSSSDQTTSSRSSHYTARQLSLSSSYSQGPATASVAVGHESSASASANASSAASTNTSSPNPTNNNHNHNNNNNHHNSHSYNQHHNHSTPSPLPLAAPPPLTTSYTQPQPQTPGRAARTFSRLHRARLSGSLLDAAAARNAQSLPDHDSTKSVRQMTGFPTNRAESISSASGHTTASSRTIVSTDPSATGPSLIAVRPFVQRNGRTFLNDETLPYPLPSDLTELHRQVLRTMLLIQVIGAPVLSPGLIKKPPQRVLEIGCGSGFWSTMCHQYFKSRGHGGLSFTGIDIAPLAPDNSSSASDDAMKPGADMQWKFIQHDLRQIPWPIQSEEYDLVMVKDVSYGLTNKMMPAFIEECVRMVRPGGTFEMWESDHLIRSLRPHVPTSTVSVEDAEEQAAAASLGAYVINPQTPLAAPSNDYINEYNAWLSKALEALDINPLPCTVIGPTLLQEYETLGDVRSRRMALPLSEFRWEKEGIGGVITTDVKPESKGKEPPPTPRLDKKTLTAGQIALRQTALLTQVQEIQALEPILREVSGKSQDEWDMWLGKMMSDLMDDNRASLSECLEFGAWYAKKKKVAT
jgi:SAM-dependent methyltransferase